MKKIIKDKLNKEYYSLIEKYNNSIKGRSNLEDLSVLVGCIDLWARNKIGDYYNIIPLKVLISLYNLDTGFIAFYDKDVIYSLYPGYGGSGGQIRPFEVIKGKACFRPSYVGGEECDYWTEMSDFDLAHSFCTKDQWFLIDSLKYY